MSSPQTIKTSGGGFLHDYWFTPSGIFKIEVVSKRRISIVFLGCYLTGYAAYTLAQPDILTVAPLLILWIMGMPFVLLVLLGRRKRKRLGSIGPQTTLENERSTKKIPWEQVNGVTLIRKRSIRISSGIHVYRATVASQDYDALRVLIESKIGEKLGVREGVL